MGNHLQALAVDLRSLSNGRPGITPAWGEVLVQAATVCLEDQQHNPGVELLVRSHSSQICALDWQNGDDQMRRCYNDSRRATEYGAEGIAILVVETITPWTIVERSDTGTGIDLWLGEDDEDDLPFARDARLEVTGIRKGNDTKIAKRVRERVERLERINNHLPAFIIVVEFSAPLCEVQQR